MKGIVVLNGISMVHRFLGKDAFRNLEAEHELVFAILGDSAQIRKDLSASGLRLLDNHRVVWLRFYQSRFKHWLTLFNISCILYQDKSSSFKVRYQESRSSGWDRLERLAQPDIYQSYRKQIQERMGLHPGLLDLMLREQPDFIVVPSSGVDQVTDDVLQMGNKLGIPTLMLIFNWDNLSSKGIYHFHPTLLGVWGEQSRRHAIDIQGFEANHVFSIGAVQYPSIEALPPVNRAAIRMDMGLPADVTTVLFAGTLRLFDETTLLQRVEEAIESGTLPKIHVLYRPHPWRHRRTDEPNFLDFEWKHITLDPSIASIYEVAKQSSKNINMVYDTDTLLNLYQVVDAVISPMSTILLESMMFGLPTMAVAFTDGKHSWSADKVSQMHHFKELYAIPELLVCREQGQFFDLVKQLVAQIGNPSVKSALQAVSRDCLFQDAQHTYAERVGVLVDKLMKESSVPPNYTDITPWYRLMNRLRNQIYEIGEQVRSLNWIKRIVRKIKAFRL